jgi:hypothetical protein
VKCGLDDLFGEFLTLLHISLASLLVPGSSKCLAISNTVKSGEHPNVDLGSILFHPGEPNQVVKNWLGNHSSPVSRPVSPMGFPWVSHGSW